MSSRLEPGMDGNTLGPWDPKDLMLACKIVVRRQPREPASDPGVTMVRKHTAEFVGTFLLVFIAVGAAVAGLKWPA